ncbi:hypothetical protein [Chelativorans sp. M5D2P16]|uniref:hypothetical protein n=1 Tax=Chelativorans sp. M5D2P16 TaxID=3095678 RepID=UPI002ACA8AE7|nr:hypothetical protein [Chelativorans sp. M5D2P16]MDZ5697081.1 hypothetical protein [Chelativorans sp. M5D2P16]
MAISRSVSGHGNDRTISTGHRVQGIYYEMERYVRVLTILVLAVFAAGSAVHAANAASMSVKMALAAVDSGDMGDCQDCPDGSDDMQACDDVCVSPILALVPSGPPGMPAAETTAESTVPRSVTGRTGLPDPYPPRSIILS